METGMVTRTSKRLTLSVTVPSQRPLSTPSSVLLEETGNATSGQGFPKAALDAAIAGDLTKANKPNTANSIGLDIEYAYFISCRIDSFS